MIWLAVVVLVSILSLISVMQSMAWVPKLSQISCDAPATWPKVSVIVPACNEENTLRDALQTILKEDYPNLEITLINDRSTDRTGEVIEEMAALDSRIRVLHIQELPANWLGKVHALHRGVSETKGDWILITDADVHYKPGTLKKAMSYMQQNQCDFLTMFPQLLPGGPLLNISYSTFLTAVVLTIRAWEIPDPNKKAFTGIGHFMLLKREAFEKTQGFEWLRMEVVDDGGLGLMMKRSGASCAFLNGAGQISLRWYASFFDMSRRLEKNMFGATAYYNYPLLALTSALTGASLLLPAWAITQTQSLTLQCLGGVFFATNMATGVLVSRWFCMRTWPGLFVWLGAWFMIGFQWRSAWRCWRQRGIVWRGTLYPLESMKAGLRVKPGA